MILSTNYSSFTSEKLAAKAKGADKASKDGEELDRVAGNAEDEIGDRIAGARGTEMLNVTDSLLAMHGPIVVHICGSPHKFKVRALSWYGFLGKLNLVCRAQHCEQLQCYRLASSSASVRNSATSTSYCSRSSKLPKTPTSGVTLSSRWEHH